jgi:ribonuclease HII
MQKYQNKDIVEVGVDECARGVLLGRIYSAAVIYPLNKVPIEIESMIDDSKKLSSKKREIIYNELIKYVKYKTSYIENYEIDTIGIQNANYKSFHNSIDGLNVIPDKILVDGKCFKEYYNNNKLINHECIIKGDSKFLSIACASIIAKVEHDNYIRDLVKENPDLEKYDLLNNMGYGTKNHINAIKKFGLTKYHRKSFKIKSLEIK